MTERDRKRRKRLKVARLSEVSLVDRPCNPAALLVLTKREGGEVDPIMKALADKPELIERIEKLSNHESELEQVEAEMQDRAEELRKRDPSLTREQASATVWRTDVELRQRYLKASGPNPQLERGHGRDAQLRKALDDTVVELSRALSPSDAKRGLALVREHFPELARKWASA